MAVISCDIKTLNYLYHNHLQEIIDFRLCSEYSLSRVEMMKTAYQDSVQELLFLRRACSGHTC